MPLPRYEGGAAPFQQVQPMAAQAGAQFANTLANRLEAWQSTLYEVGKVEATEKGRQQAINDIASGNPEKIMQGYGFYDKAYNDVSKASYNVKVERDMRNFAELASNKYALDPQGFSTVFDAYTKKTVNGIQEPEFKVLAMQAGQKLSGTYTASIAKEAFKTMRENDNKAIDAGLKDVSLAYENAYSANDEEGMADSLAKISVLYQRKIDAGTISPEMVGYEMKALGKRAFKTKKLKEHTTALSTGDTSYFTKFLDSQEYKDLDLEDQNDIRKQMQDQVDQVHKAKVSEFKNNVEMVSAVSKKTFEDTKVQVITQRKFLTESEIKDLVAANKMTTSDATELMQFQEDLKFGAITDDPTDEAYIMRNLGNIPDAMIQKARLTTNKKLELFSRNRAAKEHQDWLESQNDLLKAFRNINGMSPQQWMNTELDNQFPITNPADKPAVESKKWSIAKEVVTEVQNKQLPPTAIPQVTQQIIMREKEKEKKAKEAKEAKKKADKIYKGYQEYLNSTSIYYDGFLDGKVKTQEEFATEMEEKEKKYGGK